MERWEETMMRRESFQRISEVNTFFIFFLFFDIKKNAEYFLFLCQVVQSTHVARTSCCFEVFLIDQFFLLIGQTFAVLSGLNPVEWKVLLQLYVIILFKNRT